MRKEIVSTRGAKKNKIQYYQSVKTKHKSYREMEIVK